VLPDPSSIRVKEFVNALPQGWERPESEPLALHADAAPSPFRPESILLRLGIVALPVEAVERKAWNLTFLVDISGSMTDRLSSVKQMLYALLEQMREDDHISLTTYAGGVSKRLEPVGFEGRELARTMIGDFKAHGSTAMGSGIENSYRVNRL
jgi:Ca-activated chloride channel family protein